MSDEYILFFEPQSESSKHAAKLSHERIAKRTRDLDIELSKESWKDQQKIPFDFANDKYETLVKIQNTNIPILVIMGNHDICFPVENWYILLSKLFSTQLIVFPQSGHGSQHQYQI
ncbi:MAG: hypothetical protein R3321_07460 [Nitrososphaeraceae archaeon]|nr:hypothetical protein [Nitrososphaeraceae archaeon]